MYRLLIALGLLLCLCAPAAARAESPLILRSPSVSRDSIAFVFAGDLWLVGLEGGDARRLTTGVGTEATPYFSPDGRTIAFTGEYEGNADVYVVEASGGVPRRLTYHPGADIAQGWTPDGAAVLFRSARDSANFAPRLFTMPLAGGHPSEIPLPQASEASYSPDGRRLAYVPLLRSFQQWKQYRGGRTTPVWLADLSDSSVEKLPRQNSNDFNPMWVGDRVYFLSDRAGAVTIYSYDTRTRRVEQALKNSGMDIKSAAAGDGRIVYEQFGSLHTLDLGSGRTRPVVVNVAGDLPSVRPRFARVGGALRNASLSPSGARALFEARGEILTVPAEKGDPRNLTNTPGVAERDPGWSPDGKWVAYFSDESGEYALHLRSQTGMGEVKKISLGTPPSYFYSPVWSPDSKKVAYTDKRLNLWYVDVSKTAAPVRVDANTYDNPFRVIDPSWSPDSRFVAYTKQLKNRLGTVFIYSLEENRTRQVTDNMSDARFARFDRDGKHLYFTASTNAGPSSGWLDMSSFDRPVTRSAYVVVLRKNLPSPLAPESDEEKVTEEQKANNPDDKGEPKPGPPSPTPAPLATSDADAADHLATSEATGGTEANAAAAQQPPPGGPGSGGFAAAAAKPPEPVRIDFDGIDQRVLALPIPARDYSGLYAGKAGTFFLLEDVSGPEVTGRVLHRFEMSKRRAEKVTEGVNSFDLSANGEKMLLGLGGGGPGGPGGGGGGGRWLIVSATQPLRPGEGAINTSALEVRVEPRAEWRQMYREAWRIQRDFFYDPNYHGLDIAATENRYEPYLERLGSRADLNYLFQESLGNMVVGHHNAGGGDTPQPATVQGGLLGADYRVEQGRYRFARIFNGENWNPSARAPLTQPGVNVREGEYLLAVNGRELRSTDNIYSRRKVSELSGGRVAYVYLPNTSGAGYTNFNRYFFAQIDKDAAVIDERFNGGGTAADYFIDYLRRPLMNYWATREGADFSTPVGAIFGPKVMIIDEYAGSGGDALPWYFKREKIGPLVGKRTWGGLVGVYDYPVLIDGGQVTAPRVAFYSPEGGWEVENVGVAPDIEVELDPRAWRQGHDAQLEKAVEVVMQALARNPRPVHRKPAYPNYYKGAGR
ncbi:MAG: PDZ domain-containing protein [Acidobacteria bacterium]|nr:PDZ domain-containing protein [Acidobacteriota bacterium]MCA1620427.1 PDZ domain-containing protein [Acidobacteriota bacterium]